MPILMRHNEALELTRVDFYGKLLPEHVRGYGAYGLAHPHLVGFDTISFVGADIDVSAITPAHLDAFFAAFGDMLRASDKMVRRRTGGFATIQPASTPSANGSPNAMPAPNRTHMCASSQQTKRCVNGFCSAQALPHHSYPAKASPNSRALTAQQAPRASLRRCRDRIGSADNSAGPSDRD